MKQDDDDGKAARFGKLWPRRGPRATRERDDRAEAPTTAGEPSGTPATQPTGRTAAASDAADAADASGIVPAEPRATLSRAERRRRKLAPSDRARELNERQKQLLGLSDPTADRTGVPITRPPPERQGPRLWQRDDVVVAALWFLVLVGGVLGHRALTAPTLEPFVRHGLSLERPSGWLPPTAVPAPPLRLAADAPLDDGAPGGDLPYHVVFTSPLDPLVALEVSIAQRGSYEHPRVALAMARAARHGEAYWADEGGSRTIAGKDWLRTRFRYAAKIARSSEPRIATGIEYAALHGDLIYVVTFHGGEGDARRLEDLIAPTLDLAVPRGAP